MSTQPIHSHATIAADILDASSVERLDPDDLDLREALAYAQVEATLALAEEQVTANLLAYLAIAERRGAKDQAAYDLDEQIRGRLGLTAAEVTP